MFTAHKVEVDTETTTLNRVQAGRRRKLISSIVISLGLLGGSLWFLRGVLLPETVSGWTSGDPSEYVANSVYGYKRVFYFTHRRAFGYPFYLAVFRGLFPHQEAFRLPAFLVQFICSLASSWFLVFALRRQGVRVPTVVLALLFAHPALAGISGIPMSEPLATAVVSVAFALGILLLNNGKCLVLRSALFGAVLGIGVCLRPQMLGFFAVFTLFLAITVAIRTFIKSQRVPEAVRRMLIFLTITLGAFSPFVAHTVSNCKTAYGKMCLIEPGLASAAMRESLAFRANRIWYSPLPAPETAVLCANKAFIFGDCSFSKEAPFNDMLTCYKRYYWALPAILGERLLGIFDNRHVHPYANKETSELESVVIRVFSAAGLVGLIAVILLWIFSVFEGRGLERSYLLFPLIYLAGQIHFHPEPRYIFPILPMLFICGLSTFVTSPFARRWQTAVFLICSAVVVWVYVIKTSEWDSQIKEPICRTGAALGA